VHISNSLEDKGSKLQDYKLLQDYADVFPEEVPRLPPKIGIDFTINLLVGVAPVSKACYIMSTL
jgi:hypothetical protein